MKLTLFGHKVEINSYTWERFYKLLKSLPATAHVWTFYDKQYHNLCVVNETTFGPGSAAVGPSLDDMTRSYGTEGGWTVNDVIRTIAPCKDRSDEIIAFYLTAEGQPIAPTKIVDVEKDGSNIIIYFKNI